MQSLRRKIKELKKTNKGKALLKLIYWGIFFLIIILFCLISSLITKNHPSNNSTPTKEEEKENVIEVLETLNVDAYNKSIAKYQDTYKYTYEIIINDTKYVYDGLKTITTNTGYKESPEETIKYFIDKTGTYKETTTEKTLIEDLYKDIDNTYFDLNYYKDIISTTSFKLNKNANNYLYESTKDNIIYQIELDTTYNLKTIKITTLEGTYNLRFRKEA